MAAKPGLVEHAVRRAMATLRISDIVEPNTARVSIRVIGDTVLHELEKAAWAGLLLPGWLSLTGCGKTRRDKQPAEFRLRRGWPGQARP
jgi:hypothetical protein